MYRPVAFAVIALLALRHTAWAADSLEPAGPAVAHHEQSLTGALKGLFDPDVLARAIVERTNDPEFAVGIDLQGNDYRIFWVAAAEEQWTAIENKKPDVGRCELEIAPELARSILEAWKTMLLGAQPQLDTADVEGATFYFSMEVEGQLRIGQTSNPLPTSPPGQIVDLALAMRDACKSKGALGLPRIPGLIAALNADRS